MAEETVASFNPDDASGLLDNARVKISAVVVDVFTASTGAKFVNVNVTYKGDNDLTEKYMLGGADQWAPNSTKTGAISIKEGGRIWNKSDVFKLMKSIIDAGFPKARLGGDLSVLVGLDVHVTRVTQDGASTYKDKDGKERTRTTLLVSKIYTDPAQLASGAYAGTAAAVKATKAAKPAAAAAAATTSDDSNDAYVTELLIEILSEVGGSIAQPALGNAAFIKITKAKKAAIRQPVQDRLKNAAFLASLVDAGLIVYDGTTISSGEPRRRVVKPGARGGWQLLSAPSQRGRLECTSRPSPRTRHLR